MLKTSLKVLPLFAAVFMINEANAAFTAGLWRVRQYDVVTKAEINVMETCFSKDGTLKQGSSIASIEWTGSWESNGDLVLVRMNNTDGVRVAEYTLTVFNPTVMTGYNQSWSILDSSAGFNTSSIWRFLKSSC
ncbi:MAG: hypothetical protein IPN42_15160 [Methylococcaceae bacterium]|nr:hypothetical protein [Methylococcaceae bacterium]